MQGDLSPPAPYRMVGIAYMRRFQDVLTCHSVPSATPGDAPVQATHVQSLDE